LIDFNRILKKLQFEIRIHAEVVVTKSLRSQRILEVMVNILLGAKGGRASPGLGACKSLKNNKFYEKNFMKTKLLSLKLINIKELLIESA
jgi:hypothetical protein